MFQLLYWFSGRTSERRLPVLQLVLLLSVGLLASCQGWRNSGAEIRIGLVASLSGELSDVSGVGMVNAAHLAVDEVNEAGGLKIGNRTHPVTLLIKDDGDQPDEAVRVTRELVQERAIAIIGPPLSRNAIPVADLAESLRLPMITPTATNPQVTLGKQYIFRIAFIDDFQGNVMARFAREDLNITRAAVLYDVASAYNRGLAEYFKQEFKAAGGTIVASETYITGETDFRQQLQRIQSAQPQALFLPNYPPEIARQIQQARQIGITATFIGGDSWGDLDLATYRESEGAFFSALWSPEVTNQTTKTFIQTYQQTYNQMPDDSAAMTYDAFGLLFQALQTQGLAEPEAIRQGLANIQRYEGASGTLEFNGTGDPQKSAIVLQFKSGQAVFYREVLP
ncbi:ABC transporter substrate-binding protein [Geitlerinema splendidum]|nr:ABC transporter substrate-binding protein [Geitlerinema splendidum]